ncbi:MAG: response regulator [Prevotella sp.]|nr:response regulator [Prevotella sp.]
MKTKTHNHHPARLWLLFLLIAICMARPITANDDYRYRNITMNDGLLSNAVRNIVQDEHGFIWFGTDNGLCRYDGRQVQPYRIAELGMNQYVSALLSTSNSLFAGTEKGVFRLTSASQQFKRLPLDIHSVVTHLSIDKEENLWVSTMADGVWCYGLKTGQAKHYQLKGDFNAAAKVLVDQTNQIWTITNWGGPFVQRLNRLHDRFEVVNLKYDQYYGGLQMLQTRDGRIWLGTWENGLLLMRSDGQLEQVLNPKQAKVGHHIHTLYEKVRTNGQNGVSDDDGCIYIGCDDGIISFNPDTRQWKWLFEDLHTPLKQQSTHFVYAITNDREGGLWIGTFYGGVHYVSPVGKRFEAFSLETGLRGNVISRFCEDQYGMIWIASDDGGLMRYSPKERRFVSYPHEDVLSQQNAHALTICGDELWIGTYTNGMQVLNIETGVLNQYLHSESPHSLDNSSCYAAYTDKTGQVWVGTMEGLNCYHHDQQAFERIGKTSAMVIDIDEDRQGNLWVSTQGNGLWCYQVKDRQFRQYSHDEKNATSLPDNQVNCGMIDGSGRLWVGTLGGLCRYDTSKDCFERIALDVPSENIMSMVEDNGALWLSTERGIVKYEPRQATEQTDKKQPSREEVQRFTLHDGLVSEQFQPNAAIKSSDGHIYIGSTSGFNSFLPYLIKANSVMPPVYITSMSIMNREERTADGLPLDLSQNKDLSLDYDDAQMVTFTFASLSYCSPEKNQYAYRLEGFDHEWNYVGNQNRATYTNLPAGTYTFHVKATNNDGAWSTNEATLKVVVHPPFWWSWYAKTIYLLLIAAAIWYYIHFRLKRAEHQHQQEIERLNEEKEKEVREARLNFFTMIAHEIRTPVSLIIGPLEKIMKTGHPSEDMRVIDRNAHRLLELVNQLLDFRKVEQQQLVMHFSPQNMHALIQSVSERFAPTFQQGGKRFTVTYPDERFTAMVDKEAVIKLISNLLTNANKYTKDDVRLICQPEPNGEHFRIVVSDNGIGIREADRIRIFEPFFQAQDNKPGTGIGLNIVKNIVDLHHGTIQLASQVGLGTTITVTLPIGQLTDDNLPLAEDFLAEYDGHTKKDLVRPHDAGAPQPKSPRPLAAESQSRPNMLIVDDAEDMVDFLTSNFKDKYEVITAGDGIEALDLLNKHEVSIIISDWMMPRMDGAELCRRIRANQLTSHIPFVMLTAKTDDASKVQGMDVGADTYIEKPFSLQYLEACIRNMLQIRQRLIEKFSTQPFEPVTEIAQNPTDNEFLQRMNKLIEENFSNSELNVNFLAEQLHISRSGLFAKIKTLADVTPNEMIQIVRLKKAAQLLREGGYQINEVCYMVGFSNPSYFTKCFQKQFGITPGAFCNNGDGESL